MVEGERIIFKLSKSLWNECKSRESKLLELLTAKQELQKKLVNQSAMFAESQLTCNLCKSLMTDCSCKKSSEVSVAVPGKRGRKRKLMDHVLTHQSILSFLLRCRNTLSKERLSEFPLCNEYEHILSANSSLSNRHMLDHLIAVRVEYVQRLMRPVIQKLMTHPRNGDIFNHPVDPVALNIADYFTRIPHPMDLGTVRCRLLQGAYHTLESFVDEAQLVFRNAMTYNPLTHLIHQSAASLSEELNEEVKTLQERIAKEDERKSQHYCSVCLGSCCILCGEKCLKLEPSILVCYGPCGQRIKKHGVYYVSRDGLYLWCQKCYSGSGPVIAESDSSSLPVLKKELLKRRFEEEVAESWVECSKCYRRVHQICALYNNLHDENSVEALGGSPDMFRCPLCMVESVMASAKRMSHSEVAGGSAGVKRVRVGRDDYRSKVATRSSRADRIRHREEAKVAKLSSGTVTSCVTFALPVDDSSTPGFDNGMVERVVPPQIMSQHTGSSETSHETVISANELDTINIIPNALDELAQYGENEEEEEEFTEAEGEGEAMAVITDCDENEEEEAKEENAGEDENEEDDLAEAEVKSQSASSISSISIDCGINGREQWRASSLPRTQLSDFIEMMVRERLRHTGQEGVMDSLTIRMVSNSWHKFDVAEVITQNLPTSDGYRVQPSLMFKQKCLLLFQNIDGIDVCLFCLYVQEFDEQCPEPNKSKVYIAYLDSVEYFRPRPLRTIVYHEILVAYLKWSQGRGFKQGHIWACPPQRGDNFIFWCHNPQQRNPSRDRLNAWYNAMLARATSLGILSNVDTLWGTYFSAYGRRDEGSQRMASKNSFVAKNSSYLASKNGVPELERAVSVNAPVPTCPPIFEGDFWVNECSRVYRLVEGRAKGVEGQDRNVNQRKCRDILKSVMSKPIAVAFNQPVDPVLLNIPDYPLVISRPMDLSTVRGKLRMNEYPTVLQYAEDVRLVFNNAMVYNPPQHPIHIFAKQLLAEVEQSIIDIVSDRVGPMVAQCSDIDRWLESYPLGAIATKDSRSQASVSSKAGPLAVDVGGVLPMNSLCDTLHVGFQSNDSIDGALALRVDQDKEQRESQSSKRENAESHMGDATSQILRGGDYDLEGVVLEDGAERILGADAAAEEIILNVDDLPEEDELKGPRLQRLDSVESCVSVCDSWHRRPDLPSRVSATTQTQDLIPQIPFEKPQLGLKGVHTLMNELSRNVCRLKDDMYVITFAPIGSDMTAPSISSSHEVAQLIAAPDRKEGRGKGLCELKPSTQSHVIHKHHSLSEECLAMVGKLSSDTSDPDDLIRRPFVDSRQTFLEMSQFRHYQFDSLRRAKHSSLMLIYHLLHPHAEHTRPRCSECGCALIDVRWHCTLCNANDYDVCGECLATAEARHQHSELTPVRISYQLPSREV